MLKKHSTAYFYLTGILFASMLFFSGCKKNTDLPAANDEMQMKNGKGKELKDFKQVNLVGNTMDYHPAHVDPTLINAWGLTFSSGGTAWVSSQAGHVSDVYNSEGVTALGPVHIPSPGGPEGGNPTGAVTNANAGDFIIPSANAQPATGARFIFAGVDGIISGWNGTRGIHAFMKFNNASTSAYTGLAIASMGGHNVLYAANFRARRIDVWDWNWSPLALSFMDPDLPAGYAPFNIQNVGGKLYVMYAKVGDDGEEDAAPGNGYVDIYNTDGTLWKRFISRGQLNAPWGVAMAPAGFFSDEVDGDAQNVILVGNFGDGRINAFRSSDGKFLGQLRAHGNPIIIEGLWAISFPPSTSPIDPHRLYFAAGPDDETQGLFGYIIKDNDGD
jgi:uncharacterized protein (TIGR03118 family)